MDLDDARDAWRAGTDRDHAPPPMADVLREARQARVPGTLVPMIRGQRAAMVLGIATALVGGSYMHDVWPKLWQSATALTLIIHGAATVAFAVRLNAGVASLDSTAPLLTMHRAVTSLRRWFVLGGLSVGLSWLFIWPLLLVAGLSLGARIDLVTTAPAFVALIVGSGGVAYALALVVLRRRTAGMEGDARIDRWFSARGIEESLRLLAPLD